MLRGKLHITIDFAPWQLSLPAEVINVSASGILGLLRTEMFADGGVQPPRGSSQAAAHTGILLRADAETILTPGDPFLLQIDHEAGEHLPIPVLASRLRRREWRREGLEVAFVFEDTDGDVLILVDELAGGLDHGKGTTEKGRSVPR